MLPVDHVPPGIEVGSAVVAAVDVVSVLCKVREKKLVRPKRRYRALLRGIRAWEHPEGCEEKRTPDVANQDGDKTVSDGATGIMGANDRELEGKEEEMSQNSGTKASRRKWWPKRNQTNRESGTYVVLAIVNEPGPARSEVVSSLIVELLLEGIEGAPSLVDELLELTSGSASSVGGHRAPVEIVIPDLRNHQKAC